MNILIFWQCFQCKFGWNKVKYARINNQTCLFHYINTCWSLRRCLNIRPNGKGIGYTCPDLVVYSFDLTEIIFESNVKT